MITWGELVVIFVLLVVVVWQAWSIAVVLEL